MAISTVKVIVMNRDTRTFHSNTLLRPILSVCILLILVIAAAGVAVAAMPPVPYFSQCDSRWGSDKLGGDGPTICSQGCALTSAAMVMAYYGVDTDPKRLNNAIGRAGYDVNHYIYWSAVRNVCHDEINQIEYFPGTVKPFDTTVLNAHLDSGHPVIVNVGGHFVVVTGRSDGTYYINDPISSAKSTLDAYPNRVGMHIYSGNPPDINKPLVGDWNGNGTDTTGIYNYTTANFSLDSGLNISFGISGDIPITGDWNGNGYDTIGVFRPSTAQFFLDYDNDGVSDMNATFGVIGDVPVAGDWDGDGDDNIGVFRQNHSDTGLTMFFLDFDNSGYADLSVAFGEPDDLPVIGDWDGDCDDNIGLYRPGSTTGVFYLDIDNDGGIADIVTPEYGDLGDIPIAGDWDGDGDDNIGVYRPGTGEFFLNASMPSVPKTIYVDDDFSDDPSEHKWDTIQEGVDDASDGDIVIVYAGVYVENVDVSKRISLIGEGAHDLDDGLGIEQLEVKEKGTSIDLDEGGNTMILYDVGFMTSDDGGDQYGLFVRRTVGSLPSLDIEFPDPTVVNKEITITVTSDGSPVEGAQVRFAGENLGLTDSDGKVRITSEEAGTFTITATKEGYESASDDIQILTDEVVTVWAGDAGDHVFEVTADWVNISGFTVTGTTTGWKAGIYLGHAKHCSISDNNASGNTYGIYLYSSSNNTLANNIVNSNNCYGIYIGYSSNNTLANNIVNSNDYGIDMESSSNNTLANNIVNSNNYYGVYMHSSSNCNTLTNNIVNSNNYGIGMSLLSFSSNYNTIYRNNLVNTIENAYGAGINQWDSGSEGNYWSDYREKYPGAVEIDDSGIWNTPYAIPGGESIDRFPLMQPWTGGTPKIGDLDGDDQITPADAAIALAIAVGGSASWDPAKLAAADMSGDGSVTSLDALMILQAAVDSTTRKENRSAVIETSMGTMTAELYGQRAPNTTANFIELEESGFYDGLIFHRVIDDFVIQGGCPNGDGTGGSGKAIELEIHPDLTHVDGAIAMARSQDPDSASSQFYICDGAQHMLNGQYAVFGRVIDGINVVRAIAEVATDSRDKPLEDVVIIKISIIDRE